MSGMGWRLERLRAMSAGEVLHRARIALRDRAVAPSYGGTASAAAARLLRSRDGVPANRLDALAARPEPGAAGYDACVASARALARGEWTLFGRPVTLADPPDWNADPLVGVHWPNRDARTLDYHHALAGDPKWTWELGRLTALPVLAVTARVTGEREPIARAARWAKDFMARAPLGQGIHHTSGIELAVRNLALVWTLAVLDADERAAFELRALAGYVGQQALWCRDHLSLGSSANNHLLAEYAAMAVAGGAFPDLRAAGALLDEGLGGLAHEVPLQIHTDGVPAEQAFGYLPFVWELLLCALAAGEAAGRPTPAAVRERLRASLEFARTIRLPGGGFPHIGDEDDGRILLASEGPSRLDRVGNALAAWLDAPALSDDAALAHVLFGRAAPAALAAEGRQEFDAGGYTVWRAGGWLVTFDHGPLGLGTLAAHGHADALSVTLHAGDRALIADPGTFAYHADPAARDRCRATPAHATVTFGGRSQSRMLGPFLWGARARITRDGVGWRCDWASGERHTREVELAPGRMTVRDHVHGAAPQLVYPLGAGCEVRVSGTQAEVRAGSACMRLASEGAAPWQVEEGEVARRFAAREPAPRLVAAISSGSCTTHITLTD